MKIQKIGELNVAPLLWALQANPHLWDQNRMRTESEDSPHHGVSDIWVRYALDATIEGPHESVWYPAADVLPVREVIYPLMSYVKGERLGGVLITKIPPGQSVKPHHDDGWHARYYDKFAVQLQSAPGQKFCFDNEELEPMPGDVYRFENQHTHWVTNNTPHDRITMIVCIKADKAFTQGRG